MSDIPAWAALPAGVLLIAAGLLAAIGSFGLLRMPSFFARMHPPAMCNTLGLGCVLVASMLVTSAASARPVIHELMITLFVVMTAPVTAMMLARAAIYRRERRGQSGNGGGDADGPTAGAQHGPEPGG
jgi:multicomponent K+:H+ antiporter subunit G